MIASSTAARRDPGAHERPKARGLLDGRHSGGFEALRKSDLQVAGRSPLMSSQAFYINNHSILTDTDSRIRSANAVTCGDELFDRDLMSLMARRALDSPYET